MASTETIANIVYQVARAGTPVNPGLPAKLANLLVSQSKHETATRSGNVMIPYTSNVFRTDNNLFGYKYVGSRYQAGRGVQSPEGDFYGHYSNLAHSVMELVDWIYRRKKEGVFPDLNTIQTPEQYAALLKKAGYYGDRQEVYQGGLIKWYKQYKDQVNTAGMLFALLVMGIVIFRFRTRKKRKWR